MSKSDLHPFKRLPFDANNEEIQAYNDFQTSDATATPLNSPLTVSYASGRTLTVPDRAVTLCLKPDADLRIYDSTSGTSYFVLPANTIWYIPVAKKADIKILKDTSGTDANVQFFLELV